MVNKVLVLGTTDLLLAQGLAVLRLGHLEALAILLGTLRTLMVYLRLKPCRLEATATLILSQFVLQAIQSLTLLQEMEQEQTVFLIGQISLVLIVRVLHLSNDLTQRQDLFYRLHPSRTRVVFTTNL